MVAHFQGHRIPDPKSPIPNKNKQELYLAVFAPIYVTEWNAYEHSWTINANTDFIGLPFGEGLSGV